MEGTHIYFNCPPGLLLSGSNSSTCMGLGNGEWEPTPRDHEVECKGDNMHILTKIIIGKIGIICIPVCTHTLTFLSIYACACNANEF